MIDNMAGGVRIDIQERDYEYLYVQYDKDGITKRGYIPRADTDATGYSWCNHTYFVPGTCSDTKTVYYSPSSATPCGTIYSGENPLLILRESGNYYFVQYTTNPTDTGTTNPKFKRGWVTKTSIVRTNIRNGCILHDSTKSSQYVLIRNTNGKYLTATADSSQTSGYKVSFATATGNYNQQWIMHKKIYTSPDNSYTWEFYKLQSVSCGLYLEVDGKIPVINSKLILTAEGNPQKAQEFCFEYFDGSNSDSLASLLGASVRMYTRCSGNYLALQQSSGNLVQYRYDKNNINQLLYIDPIDNQWDNYYISGSRNLKFYADTSTLVQCNINAAGVSDAATSWNGIANINLTSSTESVADIKVMAYNVSGYGAMLFVQLTSGGNLITGDTANNSTWYKTCIRVNNLTHEDDYIGDESSKVKRSVLTHEFGHAIKLGHPLSYHTDGYYYTQFDSIMNVGYDNPITPTEYDKTSLILKWGS